MTTVAEEEILHAAELDLAVDEITDEVTAAEPDAPATPADAALPVIKIVKGAPTDADIAALVCVFTAASGSAGTASTGPVDMWGRPMLMHRGTSPFSPYAFPQLSHLRD